MSFICGICAVEKPDDMVHDKYVNICKDCVKASKSRKALVRQRNDGWMKIADDNDLKYYDRQPMETDTEWQIWQAYSGMYPEKKPTYRDVATQLGCSVSHVKHTALRWDFNIRMQHYKQYVDELTRQHRAAAIKDMNEKHISMAEKLRNKLDRAIDALQPELMKPSEIATMVKTMAELERKAHLDREAEEDAVVTLDNQSQGTRVTKKEDMGEILSILNAAGMLQGKQLGIERTERIIVKED